MLKRRGDLLEEIAGCADSISRIDKELEQSHCLDGVDPDGPILGIEIDMMERN